MFFESERKTADGSEARSRGDSKPMRVLTLLSRGGLQGSLQRVPHIEVVSLRSASLVESSLRTAHAGLVVVDPSDLRDDAFLEMVSMIAKTGTPLVLYCDLNPTSAARVVMVARIMPVEVVFTGADGEEQIVRRALRAGGRQTVPALVFRGLSDCVAKLPQALAERFVSFFGGLSISCSVREFVRDLDADETTVRAWIRSSGLQPPSRILNCARVARVLACLADDPGCIEAVAERMMWSIRTMRSQFSQLIGVSPICAARTMASNELAERLIRKAKTSVCEA